MKAVIVAPGAEGPTLIVRDVPAPVPGPREVKLRVRAAGLNRADLARVQQHFAAGAHPIAGLEAAGEVVAVGSDVSAFTVGDRIMAMCRDAYAEYAVVDERVALPIPVGMGFVEAAALPTWFLTAHDALVTNGRLSPGESVLIQAVAAGVGLAAVQVAKAMGVGIVLGTSRNAAKLERLRAEVGLDIGIDTSREDFAEAALAATGGKGVDVVMDNVGASVLAGTMKAMALKGRLVGVGRLGGREARIDLDLLALKRLTLVGVTFRTRSVDEKAEVGRRAVADLWPAIEAGRLRPIIDRVFPLDEALAAQDYMRGDTHFGKIVLSV